MNIRVVPSFPQPVLDETYYEELARTMGDEAAAWARLPPAEREREIRWYHDHFWTPDDLSICPPEMGGDEGWARA